MFRKRRLFAGISAAALMGIAVPSLAAADHGARGHATQAEGCPLKQYSVTSVRPHQVEKDYGGGRFVSRRLGGAEIYVRAEPGLTAEWLHLQVAQHLAAMRSHTMEDCPFDMEDVQVRVDSSGPGFVVTLTASDADDAKEILERAQRFFE